MSGGYHPWSKFNAHRWSNLNARRHPKQYPGTNDAYDLAMINWLVDELLLSKPSPFPCDDDFINNDCEDD